MEDWEREKAQNQQRSKLRAEQSAEYIAGVQEKNDMLDASRKNAILEKERRAAENRARMERERQYRLMMQRERRSSSEWTNCSILNVVDVLPSIERS